MGRKKIKVVQEVFSDISKGLPYMWKFIEKNLEEICSRERISVKEGFFFLVLVQLAAYNFCLYDN